MKFSVGNIVRFAEVDMHSKFLYRIIGIRSGYYIVENIKTLRRGQWIIKNNDDKLVSINDDKLVSINDANDILKGLL